MSKQEQCCYHCSLSSACNTWYQEKYPPCFSQGERSHSAAGIPKVSLPDGKHNTDYTKCSEAIMRNISDRQGYDLYSCDEDIIEDIRSSIADIIAEHFA